MLGLVLGLLAVFTTAARAEFAFEKEDHICLIGNTLADRFQHDGWLETLLQSDNSDLQLIFRNQAFPGDTVTKRPRSKGFKSVEDYLVHSEADIIFVFFGYNESFAGDKGLDKFKQDLGDMVNKYRALKPNGKSEPRIVLFTPIAHENLEDPNLPDGKANNERLSKYALAVKEVAANHKTEFVDLFSTSQTLYEASEKPLTINGIHLTEEGDRQIAQVIVKQLTGKDVAATGKLEPLRQAVLDKNWHWFNRFRATDGNDVWGGRSTLKFVNDQTNAEVLMHELSMLDVMTSNRDVRIHALARGSDIAVVDSNVPKAIKVISNVGGGSKSSSAEKEGNLDYISGEEGLGKLKVPKNFKANLFADEKMFPELVNPVQMQVDGKGRLWVAAWTTYPKWEPLQKMDDRILILPDDNHDGVADKAITFAKVHNPLGFEFWNGGVLVTRQPDILFLKDTDGDDVADVKIVYLNGIGSADTHHTANNLIMGPDGAIYWQSGIFMENNIEHPWGPSLSTGSSAMYRFDPRQYTITHHAANSPNPHGTSFDYWGYHYANDGTGGRAYQVRPEGNGFKMFPLLDKEVRPVAADEIVSSQNFPDNMQGDFLICNTIGFLGIKQYKLNREGGVDRSLTEGKGDEKKTIQWKTKLGEVWGVPSGSELITRAPDAKTGEIKETVNQGFLISEDKNFRPTDAIFGEDGALYVSDWHNVIIGHMQHNIRDPNRDHKHGRIYRIVNEEKPLQKSVKIDGASLPELMANLEHPVDGVRHRTRVELSERPTKEVIAACREWMKDFDPKKKEDAHHLLEALWLHQQHNVRDTKLLGQLLTSPEPHARVAAHTVQHYWYNVDFTNSSGERYESPMETQLPKGVLSDTDDLTVVQINTIVERMRYDVKEFTVKAGKKVKLTFNNPDYMPHNLIITEPKSAEEVALAALAMGAGGFAKGFHPDSPKVLWATKMLDNGQSEALEFKAPAKPGDYEFVCTFPGHYMLMRGIMKVVK
jgi:putative membrane-bound dehydrogenase-like protein